MTTMQQASGSASRKELFLRACRCEPVERVPVWMMRQAGRFLPEYRALREKHTFLESCKTPDLAAEISLQPFRVLDVDAVILFSDILILAEAMGVPIEIADAGPIIKQTVRSAAQIEALKLFDPETETVFTTAAIRRLVRELGPGIPVLGFAAAPWTLACYLIEGRNEAGFPAANAMRVSDPALLRALLEKIARATALYLRAQIAAGAAAVQLFDTWAGDLTLAEYREFALEPTQWIVQELAATSDAPVILFTKNSNHLLDAVSESGASVLSVGATADLAALRRRFGSSTALQGNVDPNILLGPRTAIADAATQAVAKTGGVGHILNLGHGVLPQTPVENARAFVRAGQSAPVCAAVPTRSV
ncbi:MAG: uroporphyrinogen decarboxylase [Candidatus Acidiferrales bacterium]